MIRNGSLGGVFIKSTSLSLSVLPDLIQSFQPVSYPHTLRSSFVLPTGHLIVFSLFELQGAKLKKEGFSVLFLLAVHIIMNPYIPYIATSDEPCRSMYTQLHQVGSMDCFFDSNSLMV